MTHEIKNIMSSPQYRVMMMDNSVLPYLSVLNKVIYDMIEEMTFDLCPMSYYTIIDNDDDN